MSSTPKREIARSIQQAVRGTEQVSCNIIGATEAVGLSSYRLSSVSIIDTPTPIRKLDALSKHLRGPEIYIKNDDHTGFGLGGNKVRKLEFLVAQALASGADTLVTLGALQSNHCRLTAAVAARYGLRCELLLAQFTHTEEQYTRNGNLLIDRLYGAKIHYCGGREDIDVSLQKIVDDLVAKGRKPFTIPLGGSNVTGAFGYIKACEELQDQVGNKNFSAVVHCTGTGGTQAGLVAGMALTGLKIPVLGISCGASAADLEAKVRVLLGEIAEIAGVDASTFGPVSVNDQYTGPAYGVPTESTMEAVKLVARLEGVLLDPVYTGKAIAGLIDLIRSGAYSSAEPILFLHTGGVPGIFGYLETFEKALTETFND